MLTQVNSLILSLTMSNLLFKKLNIYLSNESIIDHTDNFHTFLWRNCHNKQVYGRVFAFLNLIPYKKFLRLELLCV